MRHLNMDIQKFYETIGVDYNLVLRRLLREHLIDKYLHLFLKDNNFDRLGKALEARDYEEAFKAAHTLKGLSLNLELTPLAEAAAELSDYLRPLTAEALDPDEVEKKYEKVKTEYETIKNLIS
ncbi:Hpt domain-containing protein [Clostridium sp. AF19-22AC]|jgi:HPt (histidine-containing phosphotransfer) domain-containing protein|nr:Hpt domain-containing protein [Clostridium sp. AF19-22AC]